MQEQAWTEWLASPETQALMRYLHRRKAGVLGTFLAGEPVPAVQQGRGVAYHEIESLLIKPADEVRKILESKS